MCRGKSEWCLFILLCLVSLANATLPALPQNNRIRWFVVLSPLFILGFTAVIVGLLKGKLFKQQKPKDEESADILFDDEELASNKSPPYQQDSEAKRLTEHVPSQLGIQPSFKGNQESQRSLSTGTEDNPYSGKASRAISQRNRSQSDRSSETSSRTSQSFSENSRLLGHSGYKTQPPVKKKSRTGVDKRDFHKSNTRRPSWPSEGQSSSEAKITSKKNNESVSASSVSHDFPGEIYSQQYGAATDVRRQDSRGGSDRSSQKDQPPEKKSRTEEYRRASDGSSQRGYEDQPPENKSRTDVDKQDSIRPYHKIDTIKPSWPSEGQSLSEDNMRWEKDESVSARSVSHDFPGEIYPQHHGAATDVRRQDSRGGSDRSSQKGVPEEYNTTRQPEIQLTPKAMTANPPQQTGYEDQPPEKKSRTGVDKQDSKKMDEMDTIEPSWPSEGQSLSEGVAEVYNTTRQQEVQLTPKAMTANPPQQTDPRMKMFLQKLMALDVTARNICSPGEDTDTNFDFNMEEPDAVIDSDSCNPLDVLCDALHGSDTLFQQEIVSKMSMCQFAIPLLLPPSGGSRFTFMLWAMRDIVKKWRPQSSVDSAGFEEDNLVKIPMPIFSFVRLGKCSLSKSKLLNHVLSPPEFIQNYFVHRDMPGGNVQRKHSDGLVETSCYFPAGRGHSDIFPNPLTVINLRGDLECHSKQFELLSKVSLAVFVFIEGINEEQYQLLSKAVGRNPQFFFIVNLRDGKSDGDILEFLKRLSTTHNLKKDKFIVKNRKVNDTQVVKTLQSKMKVLMSETAERSTLKQIADVAAQFSCEIDENFDKCQEAKEAAKKITSEIKSVLDYKREAMKLQGDLWKELARCEKELCRMRKLEDRDVEEYKSQLKGKITQLRQHQSKQELASGVRRFLDALEKFSPTERMVLLKWMKIRLDKRGRRQLAMLNNEYRELLTNGTSNAHDLMAIDQKIADGSLGVEHFIRELGQFYEVEYSLRRHQNLSRLPKIAAAMLLDGFPLELIDGDASNIPMRWITDVLSQLDEKTGRNCTVRVITVLGVQSTGKSTLLNTMFGLQFPTSSGRCTRGAFMTLLDAKKDFEKDLGCDYVMVIDTEGLKSMELASLEGSYEHDNELATVVVGLSDITIINMAMENTEEMKDILQIVIHAFLRMKEVGKKSSCQFVHQNMSDVSAHVKNRKAREKFLEQLNEMTKVSARMENKGGITSFSDIIHCDIESNSWYIPGLWHGIPPMASINHGYSENVQQLKESIAKYLKTMPGRPQNFEQFTEWMRSLWNAVKHEKFVFSFRNRLVTEAYNQLCIQYSDWEWRFQKNSHNWMIDTETLLYNLSSDQLGSKTWDMIHQKMNHLLDEEELIMARSLEKYFTDDCDNAHLLEMFKGDFLQSIKYLRKNLELNLLGKCERTIQIQKEKCQVQAVQEKYISIIEESVSGIMDKIGKNQYLFDAEELRREFEAVWRKATSTLPQLKKRNIDLEILQQLKRDMQRDDRRITQKLDNLTSLDQYGGDRFHIDGKHLREDNGRERAFAGNLASSVRGKCNAKVTEIANAKKDFNEIYSLELLKMINDDLNRHDSENLRTTKSFELDLKLCVLGDAAAAFQRMHDDFFKSNDPRSYLEEMKPQYFSMFNNMYEKRNECQRRAKQFCEVCLKPAIMGHINRHLGKEIVDDILQKNGPQGFKSRKILQREVLKRLLADDSCHQYVEYVNDYEGFMKRWISQYLREHYEGRDTIRSLQVDILQSLMVKIKQALYDKKPVQAKTISDFLVAFCNVLKKELVISQTSTKVVVFQSDLSTMKQFARDIELYLPDLEKLVERDLTSLGTEQTFSQLTLKPQDELFSKVMGCGKQCPFCKAPCEAIGEDHKEHFASVHRPRGLAQHVTEETNALDHSICSSNVLSNKSFRNADTGGKPHPYKDYRKYYPDWAIYPDTTADGSDYWRFVLKEFNYSLAKLYNAHPANIPEDWRKLTKDQALKSLKKT